MRTSEGIIPQIKKFVANTATYGIKGALHMRGMNQRHEQAVEKGIAFFNEHYPDWLERINENCLHIASNNHCPLAQAHGSTYAYACHELAESGVFHPDKRRRWTIEHGFLTEHNPSYSAQALEFSNLTRLWIKRIRQMKKEQGMLIRQARKIASRKRNDVPRVSHSSLSQVLTHIERETVSATMAVPEYRLYDPEYRLFDE